MSKYIEEKISRCGKCKRKTVHKRSNSKSSGFAIFIHLVLTVATVGVWLIPLLTYKLLFAKIGGWNCSECK